MVMTLKWISSACLVLLLALPSARAKEPDLPATSPPLHVPFWRLDPIANSGLRDPVELVVRSRKEFERIWNLLYANSVRPPRLPFVDFKREVILIIGMGRRMSAGYVIRTLSVTDRGDAIFVVYSSGGLGSEGMTIPSITSPTEVLRIERPRKPVIFQDRNAAPAPYKK
jgi:hypothetical protein